MVRAGDYNSFCGREMKIINWNRIFCIPQNSISAVKRVDFESDRRSYIGLRVHWYIIIVLNVHAPSEEKSDASEDSFCVELEQF
jgi:hypothetical protein